MHYISLAAWGEYLTAQPKLRLLICDGCWGMKFYCRVERWGVPGSSADAEAVYPHI